MTPTPKNSWLMQLVSAFNCDRYASVISLRATGQCLCILDRKARHQNGREHVLFCRNAGKSGAGAAGVADVFSAEEAARYEDNYSDLTDPRFLSYIRRRWLLGPAPVNVTASRDHSEVGQSQFVDRVSVPRELQGCTDNGWSPGFHPTTDYWVQARTTAVNLV